MRNVLYYPFNTPFFHNFKIQVKVRKNNETCVFILHEEYFLERLYHIIVFKEEKTEYDYIRLLTILFEKNEIRIDGKNYYVITKCATSSDTTKINDLAKYKHFINLIIMFLEDKYLEKIERENQKAMPLPF